MKPRCTIMTVLMAVSLMMAADAWGQRAKIVVEAMSPRKLHDLGWTSNKSTGLSVVPKGTVVYLSAKDLLGGTITATTWQMVTRPAGSTATLDSTTTVFTTFRTDTVGQYQIRLTITTASGSADTTLVITSAKYTGVGSVGNVAPNIAQGQCAACHGGSFPSLPDMVTPWRTSGHATRFQRGIDGNPPYYASYCMPCHTTGYDTQPTATNNGFDDQMVAAGWTFPTRLQPGNFDTVVARHPQLAQVGVIGCESCHGPGSQHYGVASKTAVSIGVGVCAQCHDQPWRRPIVNQWENTKHANPIYSGSFRQLPTNPNYMTNNFDNCARCHDGQAFINFTKGVGTATDSLFAYNLNAFSCTMCHEPHNNSANPYQLRKVDADTLKNGFPIPASVGAGGLCMNCHKTRRVGETYPLTATLSRFWSPHYGVQTDMLLGQNAHTYGQQIPGSVAHRLVRNTCVGCHMAATPDTGQVGRDLIGGHTWNMEASVGEQHVYNVKGCQDCHGPITRFTDIVAAFDYDGDGTIEPFIYEVKGLKTMLAMALPPIGVDSVAWELIRLDPDSVRLKKAFYNYQFVKYDNSNGIHNPKYAIGLLQRSITYLTGVEFRNPDAVPLQYALDQNYPNPFNPSTVINFAIPEKGVVKLGVYDVLGRLVSNLIDEELVAGNYSVTWNGTDQNGRKVASGVYLYRIESKSFVQTKKMLMLK